MSLFSRRRDALQFSAMQIAFGSAPILNLGAAATAVTAIAFPEIDKFESKLQLVVFYSTLFWLPAVLIMPFALSYMLMNTALKLFEEILESIDEPLSPRI